MKSHRLRQLLTAIGQILVALALLTALLWLIGNWFSVLSDTSKLQSETTRSLYSLAVNESQRQVTLGHDQLAQADVSGRAGKAHIRLVQKQRRWFISNVSSNRKLLLRYSDGISHRAGLIFVKPGTVFGLDESFEGVNSFRVAKIDNRTISLESVDESQSAATKRDAKAFDLTLHSLGVHYSVSPGSENASPECQGTTPLFPSFIEDRLHRLRRQDVVTVARFGGRSTCVRQDTLPFSPGEYAAVAIPGAKFDAFRLVYVANRGFAVMASRASSAYAKVEETAIPVRLADGDHPIILHENITAKQSQNAATAPSSSTGTAAREKVKATLVRLIAGRTTYTIESQQQTNQTQLVLKPLLNRHRVESCADGRSLAGIQIECREAPVASDHWRWQLENISEEIPLLAISVIVALTIFLFWLSKYVLFLLAYGEKVSETNILGTSLCLAAALFLLTLGSEDRLFAANPAIIADAVASNPAPAILAWAIGCISVFLSRTLSITVKLFVLFVTVLIAIGNTSVATLGFASQDLRISRFYEDSLSAIKLGAVAICLVMWIPVANLRSLVTQFVPASAEGRYRQSISEFIQERSQYLRWTLYLPWQAILPIFKLFASIRRAAAWAKANKWVFLFFFGLVVVAAVAVFLTTSGTIKYGALLLLLLCLSAIAVWAVIAQRSRLSKPLLLKATVVGMLRLLTTPFSLFLNNPMPAVLFLLLGLAMAAWIFLGAEEGIAGAFQPSELIKALLAIILSALVVSVQRRDLGSRIKLRPAEAALQLLLFAVVLAAVFLAPVIKSDHSPFFIIVLLLLLSSVMMAGFHLAVRGLDWVRQWVKYGGRQPLLKRKTPVWAQPNSRFRRYLNNKVRFWPLNRPVETFSIVGILLTTVFIWLAASTVAQDTEKSANWFETHMYGTFRTPMLRFRSWIELHPTLAKPDRGGIYDVDYPDTGRQVSQARKLLNESGCFRFRRLPNARLSDTLPGWADNRFLGAFWEPARWGLEQSTAILKPLSRDICKVRGDAEAALGTALRVPAIHNDFASVLLFASLGRDNFLVVPVVQMLVLLTMMSIAFNGSLRPDGSGEQRFAIVTAAYATVGFAVLYFLHWTLSILFALGYLPVMGQPATFISAGKSHFLFIGVTGILVTIAAARLQHERLLKRRGNPPVEID